MYSMSVIRRYHEAGSKGSEILFFCSSKAAVNAAKDVIKECGAGALFCAASNFLIIKYGNDRNAAVALTV